MDSIMTRYGPPNGPRLKPQQRDRLLNAITSADMKADEILPLLCSPSTIYIDIEPLVDLVSYHAAEDEQRAVWCSNIYHDMHAYAWSFRDVLHNVSLAE